MRISNQKGYMTGGSCESHKAGDSIHIVFHIPPTEAMDSLPEGFRYEKKSQAIIYWHKRNVTEVELQKQKERKLDELLTGCKALKSYYRR